MKVECLKENLVSSITLAERVTGKQMPLEVLGYLLCTAENNTLIIRATNLDLGVEIRVPARVSESGTVAIPGNVLQKFLASVYDSHSVTLAQEGEKVVVSTKSSTATINTHPHDDFPTLPHVEDGTEYTLNTKDMVRGIRSVSFSASQSTVKPELASVYMCGTQERGLVFTATDSFRLAEKTVSLKKPPVFDPILIPVKNIPELVRVLESSNEQATVTIGEAQLSIQLENVYITTRLVDGTFPDYQQIIPKESTTDVTVLKQDLMNALKTSAVFADKFNQVRFSVHPSESNFEIYAENTEVGAYTESLSATLNGEDVDIHFNHRYVMDVFQAMEADSLSLYFNGVSKPMVMHGVSDSSFTYLVMPMNK